MRLLFCVLVSAFWSGGLMATPPQASGATPLYQQLVQQALQAEVDDQPCQRKALLAAALETDPEYAPARWHSGHVRLADGWATAEEAAARNRGDASLAEYRQLRNSSAPTAQAHLQLARYCRVHGLKDQEQMHWSYLLALAPNNPQALRALGLRKYKNQYLRAEQIEQFKATERLQQDLEKHWKRWCTQLRRDLASADSATRQAALAALHHLRHPEAIPWLDTEFADADDDAQLAIIAALGEMEEQIATLALVRRAVLPDSPDVREAAAQQLRRRPIYGYAPVLISSIAPPVELSYYVQALRDGVLAHYSFFYEGPEADYLLSICCRSPKLLATRIESSHVQREYRSSSTV